MDIILLLLGIGLTVYGAHFLVDGGSAIARHYNIPTLVIGSTIVAFGTSMPEFTVNINSALNGNTDLVPNTAVITNVAVTALLVVYVALSKKRTLGRLMGGLLLAIYAAYIGYSLMS